MRLLTIIFFVCFLFCDSSSFAQITFTDQIPGAKKYDPAQVIDPDYGIQLYDKLIFALGGDSVRYGKKGYNVQGWVEDYYITGSILHKGFYEDGQLKVFKNFYPNGNVERSFRIVDMKRCELVIYYQDGKVKSEISYYESNAQKEVDYYPNGVVSFIEENEKNNNYLYKRNLYREDGTPKVVFEITDKKKKIYFRQEYHDNGKLKEEGGMKYSPDLFDYVKDGNWVYYDETGAQLRKEKYANGSILK